MSENSILAIAQSGIQNGITGLKKNAAQLASKEFIQPESSAATPTASLSEEANAGTPATSPGSVTNELVEMKMNKYQVLASGKVVQTVDEMLGSLLDEKV